MYTYCLVGCLYEVLDLAFVMSSLYSQLSAEVSIDSCLASPAGTSNSRRVLTRAISETRQTSSALAPASKQQQPQQRTTNTGVNKLRPGRHGLTVYRSFFTGLVFS